jgi:hypothetical protein
MKVGKTGLKMKSGPDAGKVKHFESQKKRDNFEKVAAAYSHGWKGPKGGK